MVQANR